MNNNKIIEINAFWEQGTFSSFRGVNNTRINYAHFTHKPAAQKIVISPGRCESYLKYKEHIFELYENGYSIYIVDHRGQGLSERLITQTHKGHVERFDDYANDLHHFITTIVNPNRTTPLPYLIAHSMGSAISLRMFQLYPKVIHKAVLLSPMIAINTSKIPDFVAVLFVRIMNKINKCLSNQPWYFFGQSSFQVRPFQHNRQTHCQQRYNAYLTLYKECERIQLGGVTINWLNEAFKTEKKLLKNLHKIETPLCVMQASKDRVIDNHKLKAFCKKLHHLSPRIISKDPTLINQARHELLFEKDSIRDHVFSVILDFFNEPSEVCGS